MSPRRATEALSRVFIGSSKEAEPIARAIKAALDDDADVTIWSQGVYQVGEGVAEALDTFPDDYDFGVFIFSGDDKSTSRHKQSPAPRDNVLLEFGIFLGRLGRDRCYYVFNKEEQVKIPSDLQGVTGAGYRLQSGGNLSASVGTACDTIRDRIKSLRPRARVDESALAAHQRFNAFCARIQGNWWERVGQPGKKSALSFVTIESDEATASIKLDGRVYDTRGNLAGKWDSAGSCIKFNENRVLYYWRGYNNNAPTDPYEGFGEINFHGSGGKIHTADGTFSDTNLADLTSTTKKSFILKRTTDREAAIMVGSDEERIAGLVKKTLQQRR